MSINKDILTHTLLGRTRWEIVYECEQLKYMFYQLYHHPPQWFLLDDALL